MENNQRNSRKRLNSLILLVAFTAVMLIVSTYAWFSTQRNVTISALKGKVNVAEGLQVSLDGLTWVNAINFDDFDQTTDTTKWTQKSSSSTNYFHADTEDPSFQRPAGAASDLIINTTPSQYLPVSTTGLESTNDGIGQKYLKFYQGELDNESAAAGANSFYTFKGTKQVADFDPATTEIKDETSSSGYFAFDLFLQNTSKTGIVQDKLQLDPFSVLTANSDTYGTQNTARVAFALYENSGTAMAIDGNNENIKTIAGVVAGTSTNKNIKDIAIWEPNAEKHVQSIIDSFNAPAKYIKWPASWTYNGVAQTLPTGNFANDQKLPTYALTSASTTAKYIVTDNTEPTPDVMSAAGGILNIYDWTSDGATAGGLQLQLTTQTDTTTRLTPIDLISIDETINPTEKEYEDADSATNLEPVNDKAFDIVAGQLQKIRVYVWMEGQDPDCLNYASLGGGLTLNLGFSKPENNPS